MREIQQHRYLLANDPSPNTMIGIGCSRYLPMSHLCRHMCWLWLLIDVMTILLTSVADGRECYLSVDTTGITADGGYGGQVTTPGCIWRQISCVIYATSNCSEPTTVARSGFTKLVSTTTTLQWAPWRITEGFLIGHSLIKAGADIHAHRSSNHKCEVNYSKIRPYLGLGWRHQPQHTGLHLYADIGIAYGTPTLRLKISKALQRTANTTTINVERRKIQHQANRLRWYPLSV